MRTNDFLATVLLLLSAMITANFAVAAGNSIDDGFDTLDKAKGGSKTTGQGIDAGFGSLDKGKGSIAAGQGVDAGFGALDKGKSKGNAATGHSIEAGFQDVAAQRAEKAAQKERIARIRMEEEAKKQDQDMEKDCSAPARVFLRMMLTCDSSRCFNQKASNPEWWAAKVANFNAEQDERERQVNLKAESHKQVCDAWKAAGPTANSASFKAQLRQQDDAVAAAQRTAAEAARQRDALIDADIKKNMAQEESAREAERKAAENSANAAKAARAANESKIEKAAAARESAEAKRKAQLPAKCLHESSDAQTATMEAKARAILQSRANAMAGGDFHNRIISIDISCQKEEMFYRCRAVTKFEQDSFQGKCGGAGSSSGKSK